MPMMTLIMDRKPVNVYETAKPVIRIGRDPAMDIAIDNIGVSREQAEIWLEGGTWKVRDLGSSNGTFLNGERLTDAQLLRPGDEIAFGKFSLLFERRVTEPIVGEPPAARRSAQPEGTLALKPEETEQLLQMAALKRRAQLQWEAGRRRGTHYLEGGALVGRSALCDLRVSAGAPTPFLILILRGSEGFEVRNLSRLHRMRVNGKVTARAQLRSEDTIRVARLRLTFMDEVR